MTHYNFTKMHGLGNDFIVFDGINQNLSVFYDLEKRVKILQNIGHRQFGIGCDQILIVEKNTDENSINIADFYYRIFNRDGMEVEQCGNGARCFMEFITSKNLTAKTTVHVATKKGIIILTQIESGMVEVNMGKPQFLSPDFLGEHKKKNIDLNYFFVSMGNPHAVFLNYDLNNESIKDIMAVDADTIKQHALELQNNKNVFPNGVNVNFASIIDENTLSLRTYERGSGETFACGSGACATVMVYLLQLKNKNKAINIHQKVITVQTKGGNLFIYWNENTNEIFMKGPAVTVFEGSIEL